MQEPEGGEGAITADAEVRQGRPFASLHFFEAFFCFFDFFCSGAGLEGRWCF